MKVLLVLGSLLYSSLFAQYEAGKIEMHGGKDQKILDEKIKMIGTTFSTIWGKKKVEEKVENKNHKNYLKIDNIEKIGN